jgi:hypothetical protein
MSYKQMERRLAVMEREAEQAAERAYTDWLKTLSEAELEALCATDAERNPEGQAELEAMSEAELDHALATGRMSAREWDMALLQGKELVAALHASQERTNAAA